MLTLEKKSQLEALHTGNVKESLNLEYKASPAIDKKDDTKKLEMARDVCAFANADGGQILYGMTEKDHEPAGLDNGVDGTTYPEIWFEQVLQQHITPPIPGLRIRHIPLTKPMVAVVIDIPATKGDPHQVSDGRYYRRHNFNRLVMEHYEVRDAMRRAVDPDIVLEFDLLVGQPAARNKSRNGRSNCGAIQATAGSASRSAVICRNNSRGSTPGWLSGNRSSAIAEIFVNNSSSVGASAAAGMSSQCPLQTDASSSHAAEIVKITGFDMFGLLSSMRPAWGRHGRYAGNGEIQLRSSLL
jgi:hypothetical protein